MQKVISILPFEDLEEGVARLKGDTFSVSDERAKYLESIRFVDVLEEVVSSRSKKK